MLSGTRHRAGQPYSLLSPPLAYWRYLARILILPAYLALLGESVHFYWVWAHCSLDTPEARQLVSFITILLGSISGLLYFLLVARRNA